ncbi:hypothetical protein PC9H_006788 [Pleurotus ostreatus]|uniref:CBM1 domain-containing protein n=1 Tax=Pleurotus ostreatus TaxID=5322 RepID=A0A8H7DRU1_PLEOS|nr:uncharacterized protein PC9H_006788 [Pleurotus ostreatus]KAF7431070.1 hypothetical protein PC9H_006788 [Pleurotus ostreatus]
MLTLLSAIIFILAPVALAQQSAWGQCGGIGWTGATTCVSGSVCSKQNDWYSQCIPSTAAPAPSSTTVATPSSTPIPPPAGVNYWFSFGDSYTQTGFDPSGAIPSLANPIGNPPFPGFTATGGANWVGFGTTTFNKSKIFTYNYAYGGATIDANLVAPYTPTVISLTQQVDQFLTTVANKPPSTPWTSANSLFSVFIGINDIGNSYYLSGDRAAFSDTLLNAEFALVQKLQSCSDSGARNFLFVNVPPIDRSPLVRTLPDNHARLAEKTVIQGFNTKLAAKIAAFKANHTGVETYTWDSSATFTRILDSPTTYGFRDATTFGDGTGIFWGNNYHPSSQAHQLFAQDVATVLQSTIW